MKKYLIQIHRDKLDVSEPILVQGFLTKRGALVLTDECANRLRIIHKDYARKVFYKPEYTILMEK